MTPGDGPPRSRVESGISGLDIILKGGFLKGALYIVQGAPGSGKTIFGNQVCFNHVARGGKALYVTLLAEYHARLLQNLSGMSFFDASRIPDDVAYVNGLGILHQGGLKALLDMLRREIVARNTSVLVLDGIVSARRVAGDDQQYNEFVHELQSVALSTDCTMFMLNSAIEVQITPEHTMVDGIIDLTDRLFGWSAESSLQVAKFRGSDYLRGRHAFRITDDGIIVHPRIEALLSKPSRQDRGGVERVSSGIDRLDAMLGGGGVPAGSTTMILGPSGVGKTTLGLQFLSRCSETEPGLLFGFYETSVRIRVKIDQVCRPLRPLLDSGIVEMLWQAPTDGLVDAYGEHLLEAVHRRGVRRLFIDGLGALRQSASDPGRMGHFLTALMNEMRVLGVTTFYTLEIPDVIGPNIRAPVGDLFSLAENLILLRYVELRARLYRLISILKMRDSDFSPSLYEFAATDHGLVIEESFASAERIMSSFSPPGATGSAYRKPRARQGG